MPDASGVREHALARKVVRVASDGASFFRIDVEDTGVGIPPEQIGRLFVEFQQLDAGAAKKYQGTGLGLALTKRIAEAHGGRVEVRSTPSQGSIFSAILPRALSPGTPVPLRIAREVNHGRADSEGVHRRCQGAKSRTRMPRCLIFRSRVL